MEGINNILNINKKEDSCILNNNLDMAGLGRP